MITRIILCAVALVLCGGIASASAKQTLLRSGPWEAYLTETDEGGLLCGIAQFNRPYGFFVKYDPVTDMAFIHLHKDGWAVPRKAAMTVEFLVDGHRRWVGAFSGTSDAEMIEGIIDGPKAWEFIASFAYGQRLVIRFPDGDETPWSASLRGTLKVTNVFMDCMRRTQRAMTPSQPYSSPAPATPAPATRPYRTVRPETPI